MIDLGAPVRTFLGVTVFADHADAKLFHYLPVQPRLATGTDGQGTTDEPTGVTVPSYAPWRRLLDGRGWVVLVTGPLVGGIWDAVRRLDEDRRPALWVLAELPPEVKKDMRFVPVNTLEEVLTVALPQPQPVPPA